MSKTHWYVDDEDEEDAYVQAENLKNVCDYVLFYYKTIEIHGAI